MALTSLSATGCLAGSVALLTRRMRSSGLPGAPPKAASPAQRSRLSVHNHSERRPKDCYEIGEIIGRGSYGVVRSVKGKQCGRDCVVKVINRTNASDRQRLGDEIEIQSALDHPNIVKLYETFEDKNQLHIVMEMCRGGELFDMVHKRRRAPCREEEARHIFGQVVTAVRYMHCQGLAHRDIKLENFLIKEPNPDLASCTIKLIDFGMAKRFPPGKASLKSACGTPMYMAPEVITRSVYDERCDIWSCGILLFALLSRRMPFMSQDLEELTSLVKSTPIDFSEKHWKGRSRKVRMLIKRICRKSPVDRLTTSEILESDWMRGVGEEEAADGESSPSGDGGACALTRSMVENTRELGRMTAFQRESILRVAYYSEDSKVSALKAAFLRLDTDGDGKLSKEELSRGLKPLCASEGECQALIKLADCNGNGVLEYTEFVAAVMSRTPDTAACRAAFRSLDADCSGRISLDELRSVLLQDADAEHMAGHAEKLLDEVDTNQDGEIDFYEFAAMLNCASMQATPDLRHFGA